MMIALGWLGWTEDQSVWADLNVVRVAYRGRLDMLKAALGSGEDEAQPDHGPNGPPQKTVSPDRALTPAKFDAVFG